MAPAKPKPTTNTSAVLASEAIKRGQSSKALRILTGTGAAPHTPEQLVRTAAMFPEPRKRVTFVQSEAKLTLNPSFLYKKFAKLVTADEPESSDVYGWDPVLFRDPEAADSFIPAVCSFLEAFIGWGLPQPFVLNFLPLVLLSQSTNCRKFNVRTFPSIPNMV